MTIFYVLKRAFYSEIEISPRILTRK